jgi:dihydroneopterin aldolase
MKICCLVNAKSKFVQKMKMYCSVGHEDVEHVIGQKIVYVCVDGWVQE